MGEVLIFFSGGRFSQAVDYTLHRRPVARICSRVLDEPLFHAGDGSLTLQNMAATASIEPGRQLGANRVSRAAVSDSSSRAIVRFDVVVPQLRVLDGRLRKSSL